LAGAKIEGMFRVLSDYTSLNPNDVEQRYCSHCKLFHVPQGGTEVSEEGAAARGDIAYWQQRAERAEVEGAELRRLIFARRNVSMRLAVPGSPHWQEVMRDLQAADTAFYAAAERGSAGQALLAELEAATEAAAHFFHCRECCEAGPCAEGLQHAQRLGLMT
jgi:hypothetical protein